jgi:uncharacterized cupredoxin-like copper-binding protein
MKSFALFTSLAIIGLLASACGTATSTAMPTDQPASAASAGSQLPSAAGGTRVEITLADNTISSSLTTFKVGVPYTFVITNNGRHQHDFNINQPTSITGSEDPSLKSALLTVTQDQLPIGGATTVEYTFPPSAAGKPLEFSCLIRRHYEDGMRLDITVTQ